MTSSEYHTIEFPLITGLKPQQITFLPFGTRTIKIKVTNPDYVPDNLVLRSDHVPVQFGTTSFFSHEENGTDFQVSWGGGHEEALAFLVKIKSRLLLEENLRFLLRNVVHY